MDRCYFISNRKRIVTGKTCYNVTKMWHLFRLTHVTLTLPLTVGSNPCLRVPGYHYLPNARLCVQLNNTDGGSFSYSETACDTIGGRLVVLDNAEKHHYVKTYLDSLGPEAYEPGEKREKNVLEVKPQGPYS